jgi:DNA repair protein RadC
MQQYHGHRERLRQRFHKSGLQGMHDYEICELLLTYVIARKDTKGIAKTLIDEFETVHGVLHAPQQHVQSVAGISGRSALLFALVRELIEYCLNERCARRAFVAHRTDVENYLRFRFGLEKDEYTAALFLDGAHTILACEIVAEGTTNKCTIYPRRIVEKAIGHGAASIILAHNHPAGTRSPSDMDWQLTYKLNDLLHALDITLLDHLIICKESVVSLREMPKWPGGYARR